MEYPQSLGELYDYKFDFKANANGHLFMPDGTETKDVLLPGELITSVTVTADAELNVLSYDITDSFTTITVWVDWNSPVLGSEYSLKCHITTNSLREYEKTITIKAVQD